jgi:hypothetical protein
VAITVKSIIRLWTLEKHPQLAAAREHPLITSLRALHHLVFSSTALSSLPAATPCRRSAPGRVPEREVGEPIEEPERGAESSV